MCIISFVRVSMYPQALLAAPHPIASHQELVDGIIDILRGNTQSLKRCSLVSKLWRPRAQKWLFEVVTIKNPPLHAIPGKLIRRALEVPQYDRPPQGKTPGSSTLSNTRGASGSNRAFYALSLLTSLRSAGSPPFRWIPSLSSSSTRMT